MKKIKSLILLSLFMLPVLVNAQQKPNVLFISIDDLNDWIGVMGGHPQVKTPNLDRLAASGTLFTNAHCQSPLCNPSRTSVMTGLRPSTSGIYSLRPSFRTLPKFKNYVSMPKAFQANDYKTSTCGKIYHGDAGKHEFEINVGRLTSRNRLPKKKICRYSIKNKRGGLGRLASERFGSGGF